MTTNETSIQDLGAHMHRELASQPDVWAEAVKQAENEEIGRAHV